MHLFQLARETTPSEFCVGSSFNFQDELLPRESDLNDNLIWTPPNLLRRGLHHYHQEKKLSSPVSQFISCWKLHRAVVVVHICILQLQRVQFTLKIWRHDKRSFPFNANLMEQRSYLTNGYEKSSYHQKTAQKSLSIFFFVIYGNNKWSS